MAKTPLKGFSRRVYTGTIPETDHFDIGPVEKELKPLVLSLVERAFRRYAQCHQANKVQENLEWTRFEKILKRML